MKNEKLYAEFEDLAQRLGLKILKGKGDFAGGTCTVNDKTVIVVNKMKPIGGDYKNEEELYRLFYD